jgi:hypothetical protein
MIFQRKRQTSIYFCFEILLKFTNSTNTISYNNMCNVHLFEILDLIESLFVFHREDAHQNLALSSSLKVDEIPAPYREGWHCHTVKARPFFTALVAGGR